MEWEYLPILKWKQGERIALRKLTAAQREPIVPLIELPPVSAVSGAITFRSMLLVKAQEWATELAKAIPDGYAFAIDSRYVTPSYPRQLWLLGTICDYLKKATARNVIPVVSEAMVGAHPADLDEFAHFDNVILRVQTAVIAESQLPALVQAVVDAGVKLTQLHLLVDQFSIVKKDPTAQTALVLPYLNTALNANCSSVTLSGGSFPINLIGFTQGITEIPRVEWRVWRQVIAKQEFKRLRYSDYTVTNPALPPEMDPKEVNPSVAIRYATTEMWALFKAGGFKRGAPDQYRNLCKLLIADPRYSGETFSDGDARYKQAAEKLIGNGNPSSWRRDATSHHLVFIKTQL